MTLPKVAPFSAKWGISTLPWKGRRGVWGWDMPRHNVNVETILMFPLSPDKLFSLVNSPLRPLSAAGFQKLPKSEKKKCLKLGAKRHSHCRFFLTRCPNFSLFPMIQQLLKPYIMQDVNHAWCKVFLYLSLKLLNNSSKSLQLSVPT